MRLPLRREADSKRRDESFTCFTDSLDVFKPVSVAQSELHTNSANDSGGLFESEILPTCLIFFFSLFFLVPRGSGPSLGKWPNSAAAAANSVAARPARLHLLPLN